MQRLFLPLGTPRFYIRPDADTLTGNWQTNVAGLIPVATLQAADTYYGGSSIASASFTPPNNCLLVAIALFSDGAASGWTVPSISGGGLSWTSRVSQTAINPDQMGAAIWTAPVTTGASMTVTVSGTSVVFGNGGSLAIYAVTNYNVSDPVGATAIDIVSTSVSGARSDAFSSTPALSSLLLAGGEIDDATASIANITPGTGWTSDFAEVNPTQNWVTARFMRSEGDLASSVAFANFTSPYSSAAAGIEIKAGLGGSLFDAIDEVGPNDSTYIISAIGPSNDTCKIRLSDPSVTPAEPFIIRYRYYATNTLGVMSLRVRLLQGATEIAAWTDSKVGEGLVAAEQTLTSPQFASISDFTDLFLEFQANLT